MCRPQLAEPSIPPAGDLPELPRPRLQLAVPLARDTEVRRGQDAAARIEDRRGQRPLVRIDPDHVARMIGRHQQMRRSRTAPLRSLHSNLQGGYVVGRTGRQHPGRRPPLGGRTLLSGQADPRRQETEADTSSARHPSPGSQIGLESDLGSAFDPTRTVARAGTRRFNTGIGFDGMRSRRAGRRDYRFQPCAGVGRGYCNGDLTQVRNQAVLAADPTASSRRPGSGRVDGAGNPFCLGRGCMRLGGFVFSAPRWCSRVGIVCIGGSSYPAEFSAMTSHSRWMRLARLMIW